MKNMPSRQHGVTMLVPAFNEASSIADTIISLQNQSRPPESIIVIDDFSTDATGEIALALGATVVRPPRNTGSKAGAQNFALPLVRTEFCMAIDADTVLAPDSVEKIMASIETSDAAAACGFVLPRHVRTIWSGADTSSICSPLLSTSRSKTTIAARPSRPAASRSTA